MLNEKSGTKLNFNNIDELLSPILIEKPCGDYLRRHDLIIKLKELRTKIINNDENLGVWAKKNRDLPKWEDVAELCEKILIKHSKDLQVCAYYLEAKLHTESFLGLAKTLSLFCHFCQKYWEEIFPPIEEDNLELRLAPFHWLQINLSSLIKGAPLSSKNRNISWFWYENEINIGTHESLNAKNFLFSGIEKENDEAILNLYSAFQDILSSLQTLEEEYISIFSQMDIASSITFSEVISLCEEIISFIKPIYTKRIDLKLPPLKASSFEENDVFENINHIIVSKENENTKNSNFQFYSGSEITSCEEAYQLIATANSFLLKNDPHSPSPYLVRRALEWRKKSLYGVLMELFTTTSKPQEIFTLLGLSHLDKIEGQNE